MVTVVFADLGGFTALAEHRDPESVKELLDSCFDRLVPVVEDHGGHVDKVIGDELMAVFGAPTSHEDDPQRAVRAALALGPALSALDPSLRLRVGVNTGEVLAGAVGPSLGYTVTGDVVNTAHRLAAEARPGEVLVGERTRQATIGVPYRLRGDLDLKGKADLVRAWVADPVGGVGSRGTQRDPEDVLSPLVGRAREVAELQMRIEEGFAAHQPEVTTVVGEAGVGKTRLALEVAEAVSAGPFVARVLWVSCPPYGPGGDLSPLADLVRAALGISPSHDRSAQERLVRAAAAAVAAETGTDEALLGGRLNLLLGLGPSATRPVEADTSPRVGASEQLVGSVRSVLVHLARQQPVLVVVDDLHWAGDDLLRFLAQLPERLQRQQLVVLALARDDLLERRTSLLVAGPGRSTRTLGPLTTAHAAELVTSLLGDHSTTGARMGPAALERLVTAASGNPLLLEQLVRYLVESGGLIERDGLWQWTSDEDGNEASLPDGVRSLIGARLDGLPADERLLISWAAVVGRRFWRAALIDQLETSAAEVDRLLLQLERRGMAGPVEDHGYGDLAFRHVLTRDVAYASLPLGDRAVRHAQVAHWLERRAGEVDESALVGQLAYHYERAVVLAREVDHTAPGLAEAAFAALLRAAREERRREGLRRADHWYRRARDLGSIDSGLMLEATAEHGQVLLELRQLDAARAAFEELQRRAGDDDPVMVTLATAELGAVARLQGDIDLARERFETAAGLAAARGDVVGQIDVLRLQGWSEITAGRPRAALPRLERAHALERTVPGPGRQGETLRLLGWSEFLAGDIQQARAHLWEAMAEAHAVDDVGSVGWCFGLLAHTLLYGGQITQCLEVARNLREVARRNADPWAEWTCATLEASALLGLGHVEAAHALATDADQHFEELDEPWGLALSRVVRAQAARAGGDLDEARATLRGAIASNRLLPHVGEDARLLTELARVELDAGNLQDAEHQGRAALALVRAGIGDHESGLRALLVLAEVERARGNGGVAELLLEEATERREPEDRTDGWRHAAVALARTRADAGDVAGARLLVASCEEPPTEDRRLLGLLAELHLRLGPVASGS